VGPKGVPDTKADRPDRRSHHQLNSYQVKLAHNSCAVSCRNRLHEDVQTARATDVSEKWSQRHGEPPAGIHGQ
jgi:hypothetical protein